MLRHLTAGAGAETLDIPGNKTQNPFPHYLPYFIHLHVVASNVEETEFQYEICRDAPYEIIVTIIVKIMMIMNAVIIMIIIITMVIMLIIFNIIPTLSLLRNIT